MRMKSIIIICSAFVVLIGCASTNNQSDEDAMPKTRDTGYETKHNQDQKEDQINDDEAKSDDDKPQKRDRYRNETTDKIKEKLKSRRDIRQAQVASTEDRIMIAVRLSNHANRENILDSIENDVEDMVSDKEMVIYTDDAYWSRMKNLESQLRNLTDEDDVDKYIEKYFSPD